MLSCNPASQLNGCRCSRLTGRWPALRTLLVLFAAGFSGCSGEPGNFALDEDLARSSVQTAMQAWVDGKKPKDLQPEVVVGDTDWDQGRKLLSFEVANGEETTDGSNLYIRVNRRLETGDSKVTYVVGTTPVVTIFPQ